MAANVEQDYPLMNVEHDKSSILGRQILELDTLPIFSL